MAVTPDWLRRLGSPWCVVPACLIAGAAVGQLLPPLWDEEAGGLWREAEGRNRDRVAMPTLHPIIESTGNGVVGVQATLAPEAAARVPPDGTVQVASPGVLHGTGFIVHEEGLVVTSRHLIEGASTLVVRIPGEELTEAELVGEDRLTDLAVLRLINAPTDLTVLPVGRSESLRQGDWVVTMGHPYGYTQTVTPGIVSYVGRHLPRSDMRVTGDFIQFSAPVNPGSSGGPVLDMNGAVVGVVARGATDAQGISFAVPGRTLKWVLEAIQDSEDGRVRRAFMGIRFASSGASPRVMISSVSPGQPADRAGLRTGDVVVRFSGQTIEDAAHLHELVTRSRPGSTVELEVERGEESLEFAVTLGEVDPPPAITEETER